MTARKIRIAPLPALSSDTALPPAIAPETADADHELAGGLARTLARSRSDAVATLKATRSARPVKPEPAMSARQGSERLGKGVRKAPIGPRSGHR
ncbi:MAG: hypothetical protein AB7I52_18835 [Rhizobiaceae bacterium]